jgi:hypothetical protein
VLGTVDEGEIPLVEAGVEAKHLRATADLAIQREAERRHQRIAGRQVQMEIVDVILDGLGERREPLGDPLFVHAATRALFLQQHDLALAIDDLGMVIDAEDARDDLVRSR